MVQMLGTQSSGTEMAHDYCAKEQSLSSCMPPQGGGGGWGGGGGDNQASQGGQKIHSLDVKSLRDAIRPFPDHSFASSYQSTSSTQFPVGNSDFMTQTQKWI